MRRRRRRGSLEINLTSLLDVLFCILFLVMAANIQNEELIELQVIEELTRTQAQIEALENQATLYKNHINSLNDGDTMVLVVSLKNVVEGGSHKLLVTKGDESSSTSIIMGADRIANLKNRVVEFLEDIINTMDAQSLYVYFYCDKTHIYTAEYQGIVDSLSELEKKHKELFYQIKE